MEERKKRSCKPQIEIVEQPSNTRFWYEHESKEKINYIQGPQISRKIIFPSIRILNYTGPVKIIISCVTKDAPYKPHPHKLFNGVDVNKHGVCFIQEDYSTDRIYFEKLGINGVSKNDIIESLTERENIEVDPFNTGFEHKFNVNDIQLDCVRLCFQAILESPAYCSVSLDPVVSDPLYNTRATTLNICWLSQSSASMAGGSQLCILCEKVSGNDIEVLFYHEDSNWKARAKFVGPRVFRGVAIIIETPEYKTDKSSENLDEPIEVNIQLKRLSDGSLSDPAPFQMLPLTADNFGKATDKISLKRKRAKYKKESSASVCKTLQDELIKNQGKELRNGARELWELSPATGCMNTAETYKLKPYRDTLQVQSRLLKHCQIDSVSNIRSKNSIEHDPVTRPRYNLSILSQAEVPKQFPTCNSLDTLNSDSWIQDLLDVINEDLDSTQKVISNSSTTKDEVVYEPNTNFLTLNLPPAGFAYMTDSNKTGSPNTQYLEQFFHSEFMQEANYLSDLDDICISDLIPDVDFNIEDFY